MTQTRARWKTCVDKMVKSFMPTAVGQLYTKAYFNARRQGKGRQYCVIAYVTSFYVTAFAVGQRYVTKYITASVETKVSSTRALLTSHHFTSHLSLLAGATSPSTSPPPPWQ